MQSRRMSLLEASLNTLTGYIISVITQILVFPQFGVHMTLETHLITVGIFTVISIVRSYFWRRLFNRFRSS